MGKVGLAYLFWSKAGIDDRTLADLRLKVDGKLDRSDEMKSIYRRILKNEHAAAEQSGQGNRHPYPLVGYEDYDYDDYPVIINEADGEYDDDYGFGYWTDDGYFLEYDYEYEAETYYDPEGDVYYEEGQDGEWYEMDCDHSAEDWSDTYKASKGKKGKGKGHDSKGKGSSSSGGNPSKGGGKQPHGRQCTECGSKFHDSAHCPMHRNSGQQQSSQNSSAGQHHQAPEQDQAGQEYDENWQDWGEDEDYWQKRRKGSKGKGKGKGKKGKRRSFSRFRSGKSKGRGKGSRGSPSGEVLGSLGRRPADARITASLQISVNQARCSRIT